MHRRSVNARSEGLAGVGEHGNDTEGRAGTWEVLTFPLKNPGGDPGDEHQARRRDSASSGANQRVNSGTRSEGDEATRDERRDVGALHSTEEAGEPSRGIPWREGRASRKKPLEGTMPRTPSLDHVLPKLQGIA